MWATLAYSLHLTWGTTAAANDLAVLDILAELTRDISHPVLQFADGRLTSLSLRVNQLTALPPEIGQLQHLTTLNLWMNQLTALPPEIGQLQNLTHLDLRGNQLTALVPELSQLTNLTSLDLAFNQLTALPPAIGQLHNLNTLGLSSNQLIDLPSELGQLANLESLGLHGNRLTALSPVLGQLAYPGIQAVSVPPRYTRAHHGAQGRNPGQGQAAVSYSCVLPEVGGAQIDGAAARIRPTPDARISGFAWVGVMTASCPAGRGPHSRTSLHSGLYAENPLSSRSA